MKLLLDMGISPRIASQLRDAGHDALHLQERGLRQLPDPDVLHMARVEERVLLTHDLDFADLLAASRAELPSVVLFRLRSMRPENVGRHLDHVLDNHANALRDGAILIVEDGRIRLRALPLADA